MKIITTLALSTTLVARGSAGRRMAQDKVTFATNWLAQAEHGGYYQAIADGTYAEYGLDVTIMQGGPQSPGRPMLVSGQVQFYMGGATGAINAVKEGIPTITLAAIFQKDPQILMSHPGKFATFPELAGASKYILSADGFTLLFQLDEDRMARFRRRKIRALPVQSGLVPVRRHGDPAGLPDLRAALDRARSRLCARRVAAGRPGLSRPIRPPSKR